ncbi:hypothetical protein VNI00_002746 [Paramarasmius palmivorus]|uniref:Protein mms22 n=1 Tax=Paramarasmius palmivorus TaxID=297713 RepID=A0AAW0DTY5_9AGAR
MQNTETEPNPEEYVETSEPEEIEVCWKRKRNGEVEAYPAKRKRVEDQLGLDLDESVSSPIEDVHSELPHEALEQMSLEVDNASDYMDMDMDASQDPLNFLIPSQGTPPPPTSDRDTDPMTPATSIFSSEPPRSSYSPPPPPLPVNVDVENSQDPLCLSAGAGEEREEEGQDLGLFGDDEDEDDRPLGSPSTRERDVEVLSIHSRSPSPALPVQPSSPLSSPPQPQLEPEPEPQPPPQQPPAADDADPFIPPEEGGGYRLRNRRPEQKNPFLFDRYMYEKLMANNPDAIVRMKLGDSQSGRRHARGPEDRYEEESQEQGFVPPEGEESDVEEERLRERERERVREKEKEKVPDGLSELESDEDPETKGSRKEYLKLKKRRKEEERQRKKLEKKEKEKGKGKKPHAFPVRPEQEEEEESRTMDVSSDHEEGQVMDTNQDNDGNASEQERRRRRLFSRSRSRLVPDSDEEPVAGPSYQRSQSRNGRSTGFSSPTPSYNLPRNLSPFPGDPGPSSLAGQAYDFDFGMSFGDDDDELPRQPSPLVIDDSSSDHENQGGDHSHEASTSKDNSEEQDNDHLSREDREKLKILGRLFPAFMIGQLGQGSVNGRTTTRQQQTDDPDPDRPLLPGQTRKRVGKGNGQRAIVGDPESSDEEMQTPAEAARSPSPQPVASSSRRTIDSYLDTAQRRPAAPSRKGKEKEVQSPIIKISDDEREDEDEDEGCSSADEVDEEDLSHGLYNRNMVHNKNPSALGLEFIDYILAKKTRFCRSKSTAGQSSNAGGPSKKTASSGSGRPPQSKSHAKAPGQTSRNVTASTSHSSNRDSESASIPVDDTATAKSKRKQAKKKRARERKKRAQRNGVYTFADGNVFLQSHIEPEDFDDQAFERVLAPSPSPPPLPQPVNNVPKSILQPPPPLKQAQTAARERTVPPVDNTSENNNSRGEPQTQSDLLRLGVGFGDGTYLGKHKFWELVNLESCSDIPFPTCSRFEFEVGRHTTSAHLRSILPQICNQVLDFAEELPGCDHHQLSRDWNDLLRSVCMCFSMHMSSGNEDEQQKLKIIACEQAENIIKRLESSDTLPKASVDLILLNLTWFAVELLIRAGHRISIPTPRASQSSDSDLLFRAMSVAARYAYACGLIEATEHVRYSAGLITDTSSGEKASILARSAEIWICLIHVSLRLNAQTGKGFALGRIVEGILQLQTRTANSYGASETIWSTIFSLCALSQISISGRSTSKPELPASWNLVAYALRRVKLDDASDRGFGEAIVEKHDRYIDRLIMRCSLLTSRWNWPMDDLQIINILVQVFKSRKYANLVHETAEYPDFLRLQDWKTCYEFKKTDSSFTRFLKLVVQAGEAAKPKADETQPNTKVKKLCGLINPIGRVVPSPKMTPDQELSKLYNRVSALAVIIHLDSHDVESRVWHARQQIDFEHSNDETRMAHIRSVLYLSQQTVLSLLSMTAALNWLRALALTLANELSPKDPSTHGRNEETVAVCSQMLIGLVRHVVHAYGQVKQYPDPAMLSTLTPLITNQNLAKYPTTLRLIANVINSYMLVRKDALSSVQPRPPPTRQVAPAAEESQETQYDFDEIDVNDPALVAVLDGGIANDHTAQDLALAQELDPMKMHLYSHLYRAVRVFKEPDHIISDDERSTVNECMSAWLSCISILIKMRKTSVTGWDFYFGVCTTLLEGIPEERQKRLKFCIMNNILKFDTDAYVEYKNRFLEMLFFALVPDEPTIQHEYVSFLLSADGLQHVLFKDLPVERGTSGSYKLTAEDLQAKRVSLVRCIFRNVNQALASGDQKGEMYSEWCTGLMSTMRETFTAQDHGKQQQLRDTCLQIADLFVEELPSLAAKLEWWPNWARGLRQ